MDRSLALHTNSDWSLVSVVIPTYERPAYLRLALSSVLGQTYPHLEIIVQDNASAESPAAMLAEFDDPRLRLSRNDRTIGQTANFRIGIGQAIGKYVALLGDDDVWHPDFIAALLAPMEADPEIVVAFCDHDIIDSDGRVDPAQNERVTRRFGRHVIAEGHAPSVRRHRAALPLDLRCFRRADPRRRARLVAHSSGAAVCVSHFHLLPAGRLGRALLVHVAAADAAPLPSWASDEAPRRAATSYAGWTLELGLTFLRHRGYYRMVCTRWATIIVLDRVRQRDIKGATRHVAKFASMGIFDPRAVVYHFLYSARFHALGIRRLVP
jgi:glycosyltransferase involved in cell wall biosynthesis